MTKPDPPEWGADFLSEFIKTAYENTFATFANLRVEYKLLRVIDEIFRLVIENLINTSEWFAGFFLLRTHASFLGGVRLSCSGQIPEAYMVLRGCLENALYGLYLSKHPESCEKWLCRHDSEDAYRRVKQEFQIRRLQDFLAEIDNNLYQATNSLYNRTIDYGAHPNERALTSNLRRTEKNNCITFDLNYLTGNSLGLRLCLKSTAQIGVCSLYIFRHVYFERYDILGIAAKLDKLKKSYNL
jgi:hypothetical protein